MDSSRKRRAFTKGKSMPFQQSTKASSAAQHNSGRVPKPSHTSPSFSASSVGYVVHQDYMQFPQSKLQLSYVIKEPTRDSLAQIENPYGVRVDEGVDAKAATFISSVRERFKLEVLNSEPIM